MSASTLATATCLVERGHDVHVLTNSREIEPQLAQVLLDDDEVYLGQTGVNVHCTEAENPFYIPFSKPFASKLFGLGVRVVEETRPDLIVGYYLEPYGLVAAQLAQAYSLPLVLRHAGSDIGRLSSNRDLGSSYRWALGRADWVLSSGGSTNPAREALRRLGVPDKKVTPIPSGRLPPWFGRASGALPIASYVEAFWNRVFSASRRRETEPVRSQFATALDPAQPTLGMYNKIGKVKGTYYLLDVLSNAAAAGVKFNLLLITGAGRGEFSSFIDYILTCDQRLLKQTTLLPFLPPWRVPDFITTCDATFFLEHDFPIEFHSSRIPREILAVGSCLVCSSEMANKQFFKESLVDRKNFLEVGDPSDSRALWSVVDDVLQHNERTRSIGTWGRLMMNAWEENLSHNDGMGSAIESFLR